MDTRDAGRKGGLASVAKRRQDPTRLKKQMSKAGKARWAGRKKKEDVKNQVK